MKKAIKVIFALLFIILTLSGALDAGEKNKPELRTVDDYIAIFDLEVTTGDKGISRPLTDRVIHEFSMSDKFKVIDRGNMNKILKEQKFQLSGCVAQECKVEAGQLLGVGKIVSGSVGMVGKTYYLTLQLIDVRTGEILKSADDECRCELDELLGSTRRLSRKLLGEMIDQPAATAVKIPTVAESKAEVIARTEETARAKAKVEAEAAAKAKAEEIAKAKAEAEAIAKAKARAEAEAAAKAKAEEIARAKAEAEAIAKAKARAEAEAAAKAKAEEIARARAEAEAIAKAKARAEAEAATKAKEIAIARSKAEAEEITRTKTEAKQRELKATATAIEPPAAKASKSAPAVSFDSRFEKLASGVVHDKQSGLEWYAGPDKDTDWNDAKQWVAVLMVGGGGWRMPTLEELKSLYRKGAGPRNMTPLLETTGWQVWSGKIAAIASFDTRSSALDFDDGTEVADRQGNSYYKRVFAVRSTTKSATATIDPAVVSTTVIASDGRFEKLASGVVRDKQSGLEWYAGPDKDTDWNDAKQWVAVLMVGGGGWRMPTLEELKSLYRKGAGPRNMTPLLETTGWQVWSGKIAAIASFDTRSSALDFDDGTEVADRQGNSYYKRVFAVRSQK